MRLLLLSNSKGADGSWLLWPRRHLMDFLGRQVRSVLFLPYAAVPGTGDAYAAYASKARAVFAEMGYGLTSIHEQEDAAKALRAAEAVVVGGGNTFHLLAEVYRNGLMDLISARARAGMPFIGWSAGSNLACPGICTTNDMPILEPPSLRALGLVPFQINPHFTDVQPPGHQGETRSERIQEFLALNQKATVVGLREGALLRIEGSTTRVHGTGARVLRFGQAPRDLTDGGELAVNASLS